MVKKKEFHFTFKVFFRLFIFFLIIYFSIQWFTQQSKSSVLGTIDTTLAIDEETKNNFFSNIYQKLPSNSRYQLEHLNENQTVIFIQEKLDGFPQKQIREIQKNLIKKISDDMIKNIDEN